MPMPLGPYKPSLSPPLNIPRIACSTISSSTRRTACHSRHIVLPPRSTRHQPNSKGNRQPPCQDVMPHFSQALIATCSWQRQEAARSDAPEFHAWGWQGLFIMQLPTDAQLRNLVRSQSCLPPGQVHWSSLRSVATVARIGRWRARQAKRPLPLSLLLLLLLLLTSTGCCTAVAVHHDGGQGHGVKQQQDSCKLGPFSQALIAALYVMVSGLKLARPETSGNTRYAASTLLSCAYCGRCSKPAAHCSM